jgi:excinuclease ABC subunit C
VDSPDRHTLDSGQTELIVPPPNDLTGDDLPDGSGQLSSQTTGPSEAIKRLRSLALDLPASPGVYLMKDKSGTIIYVGKAKVLPKRVSSYFRVTTLSPRISLLVGKIESFDFMVTGTEKEALILENNLIKKFRPRFNVVLRDDKTYPSIRLSNTDPFPRLEVVRRPIRDGSIIFGPFPSASSLKETLRTVNRLFPLRKCKRPDVKNTNRPCLNYQIGQCIGPCRPEVTIEEYKLLADHVRLFFMGRQGDLIKELENDMKTAARNYDFETAASIRDRLADIRKTLERQVVSLDEDKNLDFWAIASRDGLLQAVVLTVRSGVVSGCRPLSVEGEDQGDGGTLASLIGQFYREGDLIPDEICLPDMPPEPETNLLIDFLSGLNGSPVKLHTPTKGQRLKLLGMAADNAKATLDERIEKLTLTKGVMAELMARLTLPTLPRRLECFDLAHIQGTSNVAGMVVMEDGEWKKSQYRKFKIRQAPGGDDYAGMREAIMRRFRPGREEPWPNPDLLLIDGGRGQLTAVAAAFHELGVTPPPYVGIAKDRQDNGPDRIFLPGRKNPADLKPGSAGLMLLAKLRDEAHRFCRTYHHGLRTKEMLSSTLMEVKGLGQVKLKALNSRYPTLEEIEGASEDELMVVTKLPRAAVLELKTKVRTLLSGHGSYDPLGQDSNDPASHE